MNFHIGSFSTEISVLIFAILLGLCHLGGQALISDIERGLKWAMGARDETAPLSPLGARFERASKNFQETFPFVAVILIIIEITNRTNDLTQNLALIWLGARIIYYPAYIFAWPIRSWVWIIALVAILLLALGLCF
jgi:uncharacterized MAPEG superfamily protein